jgi:hypothetical protein
MMSEDTHAAALERLAAASVPLPVSAVRARVEQEKALKQLDDAFRIYDAADAHTHGFAILPSECERCQTLKSLHWVPLVRAALRAVPLSAQTEGLREKMDDTLAFLDTDFGLKCRVVDAVVERLAAPARVTPGLPQLLNRLVLAAHAQGRQMHDASIPAEDRITDADIDKLEQQILALAAPAVSREASVPQGGELAAKVQQVINSAKWVWRTQALVDVSTLEDIVRALSSAPGERT